MSHLVRCRGGEWILARDQHGFGVGIPATRGFYRACWNGTSEEPGHKIWNGPWWDDPTWLPVAWLCCEADPAEGPKFAAAILDAGPGDDAPALIACDWLEDRAPLGRIVGEFYQYEVRGPLVPWCRHLIETSCVACGGRRDGEDRIKIENGMQPRRVKAGELKGCPADCLLCGFPAHPTPPALAIPEVVK